MNYYRQSARPEEPPEPMPPSGILRRLVYLYAVAVLPLTLVALTAWTAIEYGPAAILVGGGAIIYGAIGALASIEYDWGGKQRVLRATWWPMYLTWRALRMVWIWVGHGGDPWDEEK